MVSKVIEFVKDHKWYFVGAAVVVVAAMLYFGDASVSTFAE